MSKKLLVFTIMAISLVFCSNVSISAYEICPFSTHSRYVPRNTSLGKVVEGVYRHYNESSSEDYVIRTKTRTKYASISVGGEYEFKTIAKRIQLSAEIEVGSSQSTSIVIEMSVPAFTNKAIEWGSEIVESQGTYQTWDMMCRFHSYETSVNYSWAEYSRSFNF